MTCPIERIILTLLIALAGCSTDPGNRHDGDAGTSTMNCWDYEVEHECVKAQHPDPRTPCTWTEGKELDGDRKSGCQVVGRPEFCFGGGNNVPVTLWRETATGVQVVEFRNERLTPDAWQRCDSSKNPPDACTCGTPYPDAGFGSD